MVSIVGNKYGKFTVIEECSKRVHGALQLIVECECGSKRMYSKAVFTNGTHPEKCFKCHLKLQKSTLMTRPRKAWSE